MPAIHSETKRAYVERGLHADIAGRAGPVLNDKLLSQMIRQVVADDARDDVVGAAGRKRDDPAHRPRRIGLRRRDAGDCRQRGSARGQMQKCTAWKFHFEPPFTSFDHLVGAHKQSGWHSKAECPGGLEVHEQLNLRGLLYRQLARLFAFENAARIDAGLAVCIRDTAPIAYQTAGSDKLTKLKDRGNCVTNRHSARRPAWVDEEGSGAGDQGTARGLLCQSGKDLMEIVFGARI